jgi:hypothetical protein
VIVSTAHLAFAVQLLRRKSTAMCPFIHEVMGTVKPTTMPPHMAVISTAPGNGMPEYPQNDVRRGQDDHEGQGDTRDALHEQYDPVNTLQE